MSRTVCSHTYNNIISVENLLLAWREFKRWKAQKKDVQEFEMRIMENILLLHTDLKNKTYTHGGYEAFVISDPKRRDIHKARVRDRLLHHAIYRVLYPFFDKTFIADSYSCRNNKGTHKAMKRFETFGRKVSKNYTKTCWILKCDIRKFFASIDQQILLSILRGYVKDENIVWLLERVILSFESTEKRKGLPLGNLTSQLLVNIYMNEFDQFMKRKLKAKYYLRYADDFVVLHEDKKYLKSLVPRISEFLSTHLKLTLHPRKLFLKTLTSSVDFLGWVHFSKYRVLRTATKSRMFSRISGDSDNDALMGSYKGMLSHGNGWKLARGIEMRYTENHD
ncbi:MAG: group II intron reverse transcriptase domain-containing protein [Candidatus Yonathbacteria bacterium]|nr:group II intron reverse transcriptase domain-containing protein [Candidatus Yonathbacteria bacterium]